MTRMTEAQVKAHMANMAGEPGDTESPLQAKIVQWATDRGYPCHAHPQSKQYVRAHTKGAGWPDVTLCVPGPRILFLELKAKKGTMRQAQLEIERMMMIMGFEYHRLRTFKRFMEIVEETK